MVAALFTGIGLDLEENTWIVSIARQKAVTKHRPARRTRHV